jgi:hypothetical protein
MQKLTMNAYKVGELKDKPRETALAWLREVQTDHDWFTFAVEHWTTELEAKGYADADISFSGFYSQGDGASFTATVRLAKWIKADPKRAKKYAKLMPDIEADNVSAAITRGSSHYVHENTIDADVRGYDMTESANWKLMDALTEDLTNDARCLSLAIYRNLREEYEDLTSEKCLIECAEANEYLFDKYGKPCHHLNS